MCPAIQKQNFAMELTSSSAAMTARVRSAASFIVFNAMHLFTFGYLPMDMLLLLSSEMRLKRSNNWSLKSAAIIF